MRDGSIYFSRWWWLRIPINGKGGIMDEVTDKKQDNRNRLVEIYLKLSEFTKEEMEILLNEIGAIEDIESVDLACGFVEGIRKNRNQNT